MLLKGRVALVTGGAIRVGRAIAFALAERGADVAITYRSSAAAAAETTDDLRRFGVRAVAVPCDQRHPKQITAAVVEVEERLGPYW
jgi:NAD(P)-dependent dehydrogenase (short-subunit alcohol dehydrogenase family)